MEEIVLQVGPIYAWELPEKSSLQFTGTHQLHNRVNSCCLKLPVVLHHAYPSWKECSPHCHFLGTFFKKKEKILNILISFVASFLVNS